MDVFTYIGIATVLILGLAIVAIIIVVLFGEGIEHAKYVRDQKNIEKYNRKLINLVDKYCSSQELGLEDKLTTARGRLYNLTGL